MFAPNRLTMPNALRLLVGGILLSWLTSCGTQAPAPKIIVVTSDSHAGGNGSIVDGDGSVKHFAETAFASALTALQEASTLDAASLLNELEKCEGFTETDCALLRGLSSPTLQRLATLVESGSRQLVNVAPKMKVTLLAQRPTATDQAGNSYIVDARLNPADRSEMQIYFDRVAELMRLPDGLYQLVKIMEHEISHRMTLDTAGTTILDYADFAGFSGADQGRQALNAIAILYNRRLLLKLARPTCALSFPAGLPSVQSEPDGTVRDTSASVKFRVTPSGGTSPKVLAVTLTDGTASLDADGQNGTATFRPGSGLTAEIVDTFDGLRAACAATNLFTRVYSAGVTIYGVWNPNLDDYFYSENQNPVSQYGYGYSGVAFSAFATGAGSATNALLRCIKPGPGSHMLAIGACPDGYNAEQLVGYLLTKGSHPVFRCYAAATDRYMVTTSGCNGAAGYVLNQVLGYQKGM